MSKPTQHYYEMYCNGDCPVRTVHMQVKDYEGELDAAAPEFACPNCDAPLTLHWVRDREQHHIISQSEQREGVVGQMLEKAGNGAFLLRDMVDPGIDAFRVVK